MDFSGLASTRCPRPGVYIRSAMPATSLENKSREQIDGVISAGVSAGAIVIRAGSVEPGVAGVLRCKIDVLLRPPGKIEDVSGAGGASISASGYWSLREEH